MDRITRAGEQALAHARDHRNGGPFRWKVPSSLEIKQLRESLGMTQLQFSRAFAIEIDTIKSWESNRKKPSQSSSLLLALIQRNAAGMVDLINEIIMIQSLEDKNNVNIQLREPEFA